MLYYLQPHAFFVSKTFVSDKCGRWSSSPQREPSLRNIKLKLAKTQAKAKQHPEAEPFLLENYSLFSTMLSFKSCRTFSKKSTKKQACLF